MDLTRFVIGAAARLSCWACVFFIVGNAVIGSVQAGDYFAAFVELGAFPATFFLHPFLASPEAVAWPFEDGTSLIPALLTALVAHPISTFVGGFEPVDA